jgi:hypothetical protein
MLRLYLDQFAWVGLARAAHGRSSATVAAHEALEVLRFGVANGLVSCPLSSHHYMETLLRRDGGSRHRLGETMAELSRFDAIAPSTEVVPAELDAALHARFEKPSDPKPLRVFGSGVAFAFGEGFPRYRVPANVSMTKQERLSFEVVANQVLQMAALKGPPAGVPVPGMTENNYYRNFGEKYVVAEKRLADGFIEHAAQAKVPDWVTASVLADILDPFNKALARAKITAAESQPFESAQGLTDLLMSLPSRVVVYELRRQRHRNPQTNWEANDLDDLEAMSVAIPYCDVVVTEKQWCHFARPANLGERFGTRIVSALSDLPRELAIV